MKNYLYNNLAGQNFRRKLRKKMTDAERELWNNIRKRQIGGFRFLRQYGVEKYILDFYCPQKRLAIEIDGGQHNEDENKEKDKQRTLFLKEKKIEVLRFWNVEIFQNKEGVLMKIREGLGLEN